MQFCSGMKFPQAPAKTHDRQIMCSERHVFVMKASGWHFALFVLFSVSLSVVTALVRSWKVSIISTSMILCTETSRWVRRPRTLSYTHLCSWPWQHTDGSQSPFLSLSAVFLPFLCFFFSPHLLCSPPVLFFSPSVSLSVVTSVILSVLDRSCTYVLMHVRPCWVQRWWVMITWRGSSPTFGTEKDEESKNACMHAGLHACMHF